ncbi:MAG: 4Fe-4S dicluster domain-containing protein [candidate division WOR-3 bacterium]|nr:4Fe-4S dicluster domain-containing protein [candidate division WOR-3 bacterium]
MKRGAPDTGQQLKETAGRLLKEKKADLVIGYERGSSGRRTRPAVITDEKDVDRLIFDNTCGLSLVPFVRKALRAAQPGTRVAVVAKGCDGRALVQQVAEGQLKRDQVVIIGVGCGGVVDARRHPSDARRPVQEASSVEREASGVLSDSCRRCRYPNPPVYDVFVGEPAEARTGDEFAGVAEFEKLAPADRWAWFERELAKCIRCYACRNACPMCYCEECFVDQTNPQWFGKSAERPDTTLFHLVRALHTAGRCVDCGACERACPLGVRLGLLNKRIEQEVRERFGYTAGLSMEATPALATYGEEDKQEFIL